MIYPEKKGFVLLYALLVASVVLVIGLTLSSIILKQLVISSISRETNQAYYAANTGRECLLFMHRLQVLAEANSGNTNFAGLQYKCEAGGASFGNFGGALPASTTEAINYERPGNIAGTVLKSCSVMDASANPASDKYFSEAIVYGYNTSCIGNAPSPGDRTVERVVCLDFAGGSSSCTGSD